MVYVFEDDCSFHRQYIWNCKRIIPEYQSLCLIALGSEYQKRTPKFMLDTVCKMSFKEERY